jgi:hypothetical protein
MCAAFFLPRASYTCVPPFTARGFQHVADAVRVRRALSACSPRSESTRSCGASFVTFASLPSIRLLFCFFPPVPDKYTVTYARRNLETGGADAFMRPCVWLLVTA